MVFALQHYYNNRYWYTAGTFKTTLEEIEQSWRKCLEIALIRECMKESSFQDDSMCVLNRTPFHIVSEILGKFYIVSS